MTVPTATKAASVVKAVTAISVVARRWKEILDVAREFIARSLFRNAMLPSVGGCVLETADGLFRETKVSCHNLPRLPGSRARVGIACSGGSCV